MAATVGATLSGITFPLRHAGLGPYQSSGGNYYFFGRSSSFAGQVVPLKATDPMSSFTSQLTRIMSSGSATAIEALACYPVGQVIHVVTQISTGAVYYNNFTMDTDTWAVTTAETPVAAASFAPSAGLTFVSLVVRSGGEVVIGYCAGLTAMSSGFHMVRYTRRTGTNTFSAPVNVDAGGSNNYVYPALVLGSSDRIHFFFKNLTTTTAYHRALSSADVLQTANAFDTTAGSTTVTQTPGPSYVNGAATRVIAGYRDSTGRLTATSFDSADTPTVTTAIDVTDAAALTSNNQHIVSFAVDGTTVHTLFSGGVTSDLTHDSSTDHGVTWGTDVTELVGTINAVTSNVYSRSGSTVLAGVLDDAAAIKYAEITLASPGSLVFEPNQVLRMLTFR